MWKTASLFSDKRSRSDTQSSSIEPKELCARDNWVEEMFAYLVEFVDFVVFGGGFPENFIIKDIKQVQYRVNDWLEAACKHHGRDTKNQKSDSTWFTEVKQRFKGLSGVRKVVALVEFAILGGNDLHDDDLCSGMSFLCFQVKH